MIKLNLNKDWTLSEQLLSYGKDELYKVKKNTDVMKTDVPCDIHKPLMEYDKITNPVVADNYDSSLWIEERSWWFCKKLVVSKEQLDAKQLRLVFEKLDYIADIFVNDIHIGRHKSVFFPFVKDVKEYLTEGENTIYVRLTVGLEEFSRSDIKNLTSSYFFSDKRYETRRILTRKPQYVFGWDWGPRVATCGITGDAYLELIDEIKIKNIHVATESITEDEAVLRVDTEYENTDSSSTINAEVKLGIFLDDTAVLGDIKKVFVKSGINHTVFYVNVKKPQLWWPNGMGEQTLYRAEITIDYNGKSENYKQSFGIRKVEISTNRLNEKENEFAFIINGKKFITKGSNWVPCDSVYCNVTDEKYKKLISAMAEMNCNFVRIWGGGLYEYDIFYELCDKYGILIWHDFMFCCGMVPDRDMEYISLVRNELEYQIKRLRNHPSIALWCGSNENHQFYEIRKQRDKLEFFGGEIIYNYIAPEYVWNYSPEIPYWNCSPYGGPHSKSTDAGDEHCWDNIFSANPELAFSWSIYDDYKTKMTTEYGMLGPCCTKSIYEYMGTNDVDIESSIFHDHTNTCDDFKHRGKSYLRYGIERYYGESTPTLEQYSLYGGMVQSNLLEYSVDSHRMREDCGGTLTWMYTDCWGEGGWSVVDYYTRKKPAFYGLKRAYKKQRMLLRSIDGKLYLILVNDIEKTESKKITVAYTSFDGKQLDEKCITVEMNHGITKTEIDIDTDKYDLTKGVIYANDNDGIIEKAVYYNESIKKSEIPVANINITGCSQKDGELSITLSADEYAHGVYLEDMEENIVSDMYFDMLPNEVKVVTVKDYNGQKPIINWINR